MANIAGFSTCLTREKLTVSAERFVFVLPLQTFADLEIGTTDSPPTQYFWRERRFNSPRNASIVVPYLHNIMLKNTFVCSFFIATSRFLEDKYC
jgi:hypothetical protein